MVKQVLAFLTFVAVTATLAGCQAKEVMGRDHYDKELDKAGDKLVVVYFWTNSATRGRDLLTTLSPQDRVSVWT